MTVNVYSGYGVKMETVLLWKEFFEKHFPEVTTHFVDGKNILSNNPRVLLFPGGSASKFAKSLGPKRREKIKNWVANGGKYLGICAGAYLASETYSWSLGISPVKIARPWKRGHHKARIKIENGYTKVDYFNGPIFERWSSDIQIIARYYDDIPDEEDNHNMMRSPAILTNIYQYGKVLLLSPHLEKTPGMEDELSFLISGLIEDK